MSDMKKNKHSGRALRASRRSIKRNYHRLERRQCRRLIALELAEVI
jgi:hypothetical protein